MSKEQMKLDLFEDQEGLCALSGVVLDDDPSMWDTDRILEKMYNGEYDKDLENVRGVTPLAHMIRHGNFRDRAPSLDELKAVFDDRAQVMRSTFRSANQLLAFKRRTDFERPETTAFLVDQLKPFTDRVKQATRDVSYIIRHYEDPLVQIALKVPGMGPVTVAGLTIYVDLAKAAHASSLWAYVGLDKPSHARYEKGVKGGGNKTLRTILYNTAVAMMKNRRCAYREVYDRVKSRLEVSEKIVKTYITKGVMKELPWKDCKPSHRHGAALRVIMKHVLADYWFVGRTVKGLPTSQPYAEALLGHTHIISPKDRGWVF